MLYFPNYPNFNRNAFEIKYFAGSFQSVWNALLWLMATKSQFHLNSKVKTSILTLNYRDKWAPNCIHSLLCQIGIANYHQWRFSEIVFFFFARSCAIEETILSLSLSISSTQLNILLIKYIEIECVLVCV